MKSLISRITLAIILLTVSFFAFSCQSSTQTSNIPKDTVAETTEIITEPQKAETAAPETEPPYSLSIDPEEYEALPDEEYSLNENSYKKPTAFELSGTMRTATGTSLNMIVEWSAKRNEGENFATLILDLAIEHKSIYANNFLGIMTVNGEDFYFMSPEYNYRSGVLTREWLCPAELKIPCRAGEDTYVEVTAYWEYTGKYERQEHNGLSFSGKIPIGEKYAALKKNVNYTLNNILQRPELPEGCEVTSLAIVLNHLGYNITHTDLADNYLEQGEVGKTSFYEKNIGNPRDEGESWGCYAPVIVKTANKYLYDMESYYRAYNYTGYDVSEIYYQLSLGHPVIVWITMDFAEPYLKNPWTIDGEKLWWKYPLHCVVLSGYDMEKGTVTITDPLKEQPVIIDMKTFELRFKQMESQAVVLKLSQASK